MPISQGKPSMITAQTTDHGRAPSCSCRSCSSICLMQNVDPKCAPWLRWDSCHVLLQCNHVSVVQHNQWYGSKCRIVKPKHHGSIVRILWLIQNHLNSEKLYLFNLVYILYTYVWDLCIFMAVMHVKRRHIKRWLKITYGSGPKSEEKNGVTMGPKELQFWAVPCYIRWIP